MSYNLLIIDDDEDIQLILKSILSSFTDLSIETALDGATAYAHLEAKQFDGLILDYLLPDTSGAEILQHIQQFPPALRPRIVMLSARDDVSLHRKWQQLGASKILKKPFNPMEVRAELQATLEF